MSSKNSAASLPLMVAMGSSGRSWMIDSIMVSRCALQGGQCFRTCFIDLGLRCGGIRNRDKTDIEFEIENGPGAGPDVEVPIVCAVDEILEVGVKIELARVAIRFGFLLNIVEPAQDVDALRAIGRTLEKIQCRLPRNALA
jgi:hypothetical protein